MKERAIQNRTLVELSARYRGRGIFWKNDTGVGKSMDGKRTIRFGCPGSPDILGCVDGRFVGIEMKTPTGKQSDQQRAFQSALEKAGGIYILARSPEQAIAGVEAAFTAHARLARVARAGS